MSSSSSKGSGREAKAGIPPNPNSIDLIFNFHNGVSIKCKMLETCKMADIQEILGDIINVDPNKFSSFTFLGKKMEHGRQLKDYGDVKNGVTMHVKCDPSTLQAVSEFAAKKDNKKDDKKAAPSVPPTLFAPQTQAQGSSSSSSSAPPTKKAT